MIQMQVIVLWVQVMQKIQICSWTMSITNFLRVKANILL